MHKTSEKKGAEGLYVIWWFLRPYRLQVGLVFLLLTIYAILDTLSVGAIYPFLSKILADAENPGRFGGRLLDALSSVIALLPVQDKIIGTSLFFLIVLLTSNAWGFLSESLSLWYHLKLYADAQNRVYEKILSSHYRFFHDIKQGELMYIGREASIAVGEMFLYFPKTAVEGLRIITFTALLLSISFKYTSVIYGIISLFAVTVYFISVRIIHPAAIKSQAARTGMTALLSESIAGIRQIKLSNNYSYWLTLFREQAYIDRKFQFRSVAPAYLPSRLILSAGGLSVIGAVMYIKLYRPSEFMPLLPIIIVYIGALMKLLPSIANIGHYWMGLKGLAPRLQVTYETLTDESYRVEDGKRECPGLEHEIVFDNISFAYPGREEVLKGINLRIPRNNTLALVGESGSGKSTLADLLIRLYEPTAGRIAVDQSDYRDFTRASWLRLIGMVSQDTFIFHTSIKENIRIGMPEASDDEVVAAARAAHAHDFIMDLPAGYDAIVGDRGIKLSGGQRQRIAIARAVIRKPEILILDEATSALDNISERVVQEALKEAAWDKTTVIIAHRLSTIEDADLIVVLDKGEVMEQGTHAELIKSGGYYWSLYQKQRLSSKEKAVI